MTTTVASSKVLDKAIRLRESGKVVEIPQTRVFEVEGDTGIYRVTVYPSKSGQAADCTCLAHGPCSHVLAVALQMKDVPE